MPCNQQGIADRNATLKQITALLASGADFIDVAKQYDQSGLASSGGKNEPIRKRATAKDLEEIAFGLPVGGVSVPLELEAGIYLLCESPA